MIATGLILTAGLLPAINPAFAQTIADVGQSEAASRQTNGVTAQGEPTYVTLTKREKAILLTLSPMPNLPPDPSNRHADDPRAAEFGQELFFDARLSRNGDFSCSTCHDPALGWSDGKALSVGAETLNRNSPTLLNVGFQRWYFWDGRADSLWAQVQYPLENAAEMGYSRSALVRLLASDPTLGMQYQAIFGPLPDGAADLARFPEHARPPLPKGLKPFEMPTTPAQLAAQDPMFAAWFQMSEADRLAATAVLANVSKAIAAFERHIIPGPSRFDHYVEGLRNNDVDQIARLTASEQRGAKLFVSKAGCTNCHFSPLLSGGEFHNIGLSVAPGAEFDGGRPDGIHTVRVDPFNGHGDYSDAPDWSDNAKLRYLSYNDHTFGAYKTPSLRNVARTGPYMHDGRFATLAEVLKFYAELPGRPPIGHREETLAPLVLSPAEVDDLVAFLLSLTGESESAELQHAPQRGSGGVK
jgi:cytochrome c peroxidase